MPHILALKNLSTELVATNERCSVGDYIAANNEVDHTTAANIENSVAEIVAILDAATLDLTAARAALESIIGAASD